MGWASAGEIKQAVADALGREAVALPDKVDRIAASAVETAQGQIRQVLNDAGYADAQIELWRDLHSFHRHQSLYWAEVDLREAYKDQLGELHALKNRLGELAGITLRDGGGGAIDPTDPAAEGGVSSGVLAVREEFDDAVAGRPTAVSRDQWPYRR